MTQTKRDLTTLEYMVLGLISLQPQSGYSLISTLESGMYRWSGSPGSIYPILKRLEKQGYLTSELELVHETRPRKMYTLTSQGEEKLDDWLRSPLTKREVSVERDIVMRKFLFTETRLTRQEVLTWLDNYEQGANEYGAIMESNAVTSGIEEDTPHSQLILEAARLELEMQRAWIALARNRLATISSLGG